MNETRVVELRRDRGWTQERLAEASGVTVRTVQRLEAGNDASLETLSLVARALEVPVRDLFTTVAEGDLGRSVAALDARTERQQRRRDSVTDGVEALFHGIGVLVTLAVVVAVATGLLPGVGILLIPAYWVGGWLLSTSLYLVVLSPRLDRALPLSRERDAERDAARGRERGSGLDPERGQDRA